MKKYCRAFGIIPVFLIIIIVCITCKNQPDIDDDFDGMGRLKETWNGFEFRQRKEVTDNQYNITVNKFKTVFSSDSFTDDDRVKIRNWLDIIVIVGSYPERGGFGGGYGTEDYFLSYLYCNSIQDEIENGLRNILRWEGDKNE